MLLEPNQTGCNHNRSLKSNGELIISSRNTAKLFKFFEKTFNQVSFFIGMAVIVPLVQTPYCRRNNHFHLLSFSQFDELVGIIRSVRQQFIAKKSFYEAVCRDNVIDISRC